MLENSNIVSALTNYIRKNFKSPTEENISKIIASVQKNFVSQYKDRYNKSRRIREKFFKQNEQWLDVPFTVYLEDPTCSSEEASTSTGKRGRPTSSYEDSSEKTKKRKNKELIDSCGMDFILNSYIQNLRKNGETDEAFIVEILHALPKEQKSKIRDNLLKTDQTPYSKEEALSIFIELGLTKAQYELMRDFTIVKDCLLFPSYYSIREAKRMCYPMSSAITITGVKAEAKIQELLDHTVARILMIDSVYKVGAKHLKLYCKWGCDGSSGQSVYKQTLPGESDIISDANLFICSLVPIRLINLDNNDVLWINPVPSSVRFCRPISIEFCKETPEKTRSAIENIKEQINSLIPCLINKEGNGVEINFEMFLTMVDGKVVQVLSNTKSSALCAICGAKPTEMNNLEKVQAKPVDESVYEYGLSTLHCWIRFMEAILHIAYNNDFQKWAATKAYQDLKKKMEEIQNRFREEIGLVIDKPKQVSGNTNDGNTARRFFQAYDITSEITGVNMELIKRFYILLQVMSCGKAINSKKFGKFAYETAKLYVAKYPWYYMPSSVHKVLIHGEAIIEHYSILPLGELSEDAQESRNKDYKNFRLHHARKISRRATNEDVLHSLLYTSDPYITSLRKPYNKKNLDLMDEAVELLDLIN